MQFTFLGTSSGTPTRSRNVSGIVLNLENRKEWFLVDCGEGTQHQLLRTSYSLHHLTAIFITHVHGDHCYGLPGLLASASLQGRKAKLPLIAPKKIQTLINAVIESSELFLGFELEFIDIKAMESPWVGSGVVVDTFVLSHRTPSYAFRFTEQNIKRKLRIEKLQAENIEPVPIWGKLQNGEDVKLSSGRILKSEDYMVAGRHPGRIIIAGDNDTPHLLKTASIDTDVLVHEATYSNELSRTIGVDHQHSSAASVAQFAESVKIPNLVLTHFSARYQNDRDKSPSISQLEKEARNHFNGNLFLANDFDQFMLNQKGDLSEIRLIPAD